jgi:hypothetical protein|tara:strand:+ start:5438 stop:6214 length:777 start_codon:yes stop_codon:yes gene_type:complete
MIKITKRLKKNNFQPKEYVVYTTKDKSIPEYVHWQECDVDDWGISDDGYISKCIYRNTYKKGTLVTFPYGRQWLGSNRRLEFEPHWHSGNLNNVSTKPYSEIESRSQRAALAVDAFIAYKVAGEKPDMEQIGKIYRPDQAEPHIAAKRLFKLKETKQMIKDKLQEVLTEKGIDEGYVLDVMKDAVAVAQMKEDPGNMIRAADKLSEFLDMKPQKTQQTETLEMDISHQISNQFETQKKKLKATQTREISDGEENSTEG